MSCLAGSLFLVFLTISGFVEPATAVSLENAAFARDSEQDLYPLGTQEGLLRRFIQNSSSISEEEKIATMASKPYFRTVTSFTTDYSPSKITKYLSERTGMTAVLIEREGPKVHGYFTLATEILDESGAPHTLEHLVFMGSKNYKYKGVLDRMATRAYSDTNAWTATDHTAYTLDSAGAAGFLQILPVYLEHVLLPTLTDSGCYTEVYHVDGTGNDAGVVYAEMQGVQNTQQSLMMDAGTKLVYPEGIGFRCETGGLMEPLRVLTADRIREFHKDMYQPKNLCVIVVGEVNSDELLKTLEDFEKSIMNDIPDPNVPWRRPWVESKPVAPLEKDIVTTVNFPEKDESTGEILVALLGPSCLDNEAITALEIMRIYLAGSSVSVLENKLVEIEDPWGTSVEFYTENRPNSLVWIGLSAVKTKKLAQAEIKLFEILRETSENPLNFGYIQQIIRRERRQMKYFCEDSGRIFSNTIITDHLFASRDGKNLRENLETLGCYDKLQGWKEEDWREFIKKWLVDNKHVSILGRPSAKLAKKLEEDDKTRIEKRVNELGEEGLKKLQLKLEQAKAENDKEIPKEILGKFPVPSVDSIHFIKTGTARGALAHRLHNKGQSESRAQAAIDKDDCDIPLYLHFENAPSKFVQINIIMSTSSIPVKLRPLISVFWDNFFNTPVKKNGIRMEYEDTVAKLEDDTVSFRIDSASYERMSESVGLRFEVEPDKYPVAISWIKTMMLDSIFDPKRLATAITKLRSDIPDEKRDGNGMATSVMNMVQLSRESIGRARDTLVKSRYLKQIDALLKENPNEVISQFEQLRMALFKLDNFRILVIADVENLRNPVTAWKSFVESMEFQGALAPLDKRTARLTPGGRYPGNVAHVIQIASIDSSYTKHTALGPSDITDPQLPALMFVLAYLGAVEGPLWNAARGSGLAYGVNIHREPQSAQISMGIYRSPDAFKAFSAIKKVCASYIDGTIPFNEHALEGALSSIVVEFADEEPNMKKAATMSFVYQAIHGVSKEYNSELLKKVKNVTVDDMKSALKNVIMPLFEPNTSNVIVVTSPVKSETTVESFKKDGFNISLKHLKDFEDDYGVKYGLKDVEDQHNENIDCDDCEDDDEESEEE